MHVSISFLHVLQDPYWSNDSNDCRKLPVGLLQVLDP